MCTSAFGGGAKGAVVPTEVPNGRPGKRVALTFCPLNPAVISFVRAGDIWTVDTTTGNEQRVTSVGGYDPVNDSSVPVSSGTPPQIIQEEFGELKSTCLEESETFFFLFSMAK
jgi:hypothetical protein